MFLAMNMRESIIEGEVASDGERLDKALASASGLSRERVKALLGDGRISLAVRPRSNWRQALRPASPFPLRSRQKPRRKTSHW
jgi:23S rRNA pseudouridine1911/1915/1917 synthase